jgi:2-hydroxychromene-2-carboxylate isomerase
MRALVKIECFFDCASPWSYIGVSNLLTLTARLGIEVTWRPVVVGFVFAEVNQAVYLERRLAAPPLKLAYENKELQAWAEHAGLILNSPPKCGHPVNTVKCMRGCIALRPHGKLMRFAIAAYEALWRDGRNLGHDDVLANICRQTGVDPDALFEAIGSSEAKSELKRNGDELVARGGFGVPSFFIDDEVMLFGNNRMPLVEHQLRERIRLKSVEGCA